AALLDRAGDLALDELHDRVASIDEGRRGDPVFELLDRGRVVGIDIPAAGGETRRRLVLTENFARYAAAFGADAVATVYAGAALEPRAAADVVPDALRVPAMTPQAAQREILVRFVSLAGAVSLSDVLARYAFDREWLRHRLDEWTRNGRLVRGTFGGDSSTERWCSRRLLEQARRRELAQARRQIEAVGLDRFSRFVQQWQHIAPSTRLEGDEGTLAAVRQLYGLARPAELWEREYLPSRVEGYDPDVLTRASASGELVWIGSTAPMKAGEVGTLANVCFVRRGTARAWISLVGALPPIGEHAQQVVDALTRDGASFFDELLAATALTARALRDALRELVGAGLDTNHTIDALRAVVRWRPLESPRDRAQPDPTRWKPTDITPSPNRYVVKRRPHLRRLPKWKRPDKEGAEPTTWPGRWSLVRASRVLGPELDASVWAESIARQWLDRYGVVSREMWRRERPAVGWRSIYRELKRLEFRGDVRRGYFVRGLSGAQFALPEAVEALRSADAPEDEPIVMPASDPANVFALPLPGDPARDPFVRPRSRGALLVSVDGTVMMIAERRGERIFVRPETPDAVVTRCARALVVHLSSRLKRDLVVETIDGQPASGSRFVEAFRSAGFKRGTSGLRYYHQP
ncbi:MAG TPA: hypothetical protein VGL43_09135, partial [Casimicrobiaceae bacterium]